MRWLDQPNPTPPGFGRHRDAAWPGRAALGRAALGRRTAGLAATAALAFALTGGAAWWADVPAAPADATAAAPSFPHTVDIRSTPSPRPPATAGPVPGSAPSPTGPTADDSAGEVAGEVAGAGPAADAAVRSSAGALSDAAASAPAGATTSPAPARRTALPVVRPGAACPAAGARGVTGRDRPVVCRRNTGGKLRWRTA